MSANVTLARTATTLRPETRKISCHTPILSELELYHTGDRQAPYVSHLSLHHFLVMLPIGRCLDTYLPSHSSVFPSGGWWAGDTDHTTYPPTMMITVYSLWRLSLMSTKDIWCRANTRTHTLPSTLLIMLGMEKLEANLTSYYLSYTGTFDVDYYGFGKLCHGEGIGSGCWSVEIILG